jgi:hypothetical protein
MWTICVLIHLHIISPLIILPLYRYPKFGVFVNIFAILFGCFLNISPIFSNIYPLYRKFSMNVNDYISFFNRYHLQSEQYLTSYSCGILVAYLSLKYPKINLFKQFGENILTICFIGISISVIYWNEYLIERTIEGNDNIISGCLIWSFGKILFVSGILWICYASYTNRKSIYFSLIKSIVLIIFYNKSNIVFIIPILNWKVFQILSKLSFGIYIFHTHVIFHYVYSVKETFIFNDYNIVINIFLNNFYKLILFYSLDDDLV